MQPPRPYPKPLPKIEIITSEVEFSAYQNAVLATMQIRMDDKTGTVSLRFVSVNHLLQFTVALIEKAAEAWPDDPYIQEYLAD